MSETDPVRSRRSVPQVTAGNSLAFSGSRNFDTDAITDASPVEENVGRIGVSLNRRMIERLHLRATERLVAKADALNTRRTQT